MKRVIVDTTVMEKAIAHPTDSRLIEQCREHLVRAAARHGLKLRQNYKREARRLVLQIGRYAHAKQYKRMSSKALRALRSRVGRVMRDVGPLSQRRELIGRQHELFRADFVVVVNQHGGKSYSDYSANVAVSPAGIRTETTGAKQRLAQLYAGIF